MLVGRCLLLTGGGWVGRLVDRLVGVDGWTGFNGMFS